MIQKDNSILTTGSNEGQKLNIAGGEYRIVVSGKQTDGSFAIIEMTVPPGAGPLPHSHPDFEESFYVLEGEVTFTSEEGNYVAGKDALVSIPKGGIIHHFKNHSDKPARLLCTVIPAGLDEFFIEVSDFMNSIKGQEISELEIKENMTKISKRFGQQSYTPDYFKK